LRRVLLRIMAAALALVPLCAIMQEKTLPQAVGEAALLFCSPSAFISYKLGYSEAPSSGGAFSAVEIPPVTEDASLMGDIEAALALIPEQRRGPIDECQYLSNPKGDNYIKYGFGTIRNCTGFSNADVLQWAEGGVGFSIDKDSEEPQVLIMHTHTTESYDRFDAGFYDRDYPYRQTDESLNMVAVGKVLAETLCKNGINTIQATECHDYPNYNNSYSRSAVTVQQYLDMYPSIKVVLDIHRDGLETADGERIKPTAVIEGRKAAQIMIVSGADDGTMDMPNFRENLKLASRLQSGIEGMYPGLTRPLLFDYRRYNQDLTTGSLLIEVGSHGNTLAEALYTAELLGNAIADTLLHL